MLQPQTKREQREKSLGHSSKVDGAGVEAAQIHGSMRAASGFDVNQTAAEYRALRASVIRLWMESGPKLGRDEVFELVRFNEAMDEALAASILYFATEAAHMRNLFLGVLSHELRTPLSTIMTSGHSLVLAAQQNKPLPAAADRVLRGSRRIQSLLDDLLDYVRSGLGEGMRVSPKDVDMGLVCEKIVAELRANNPGRVIELETLGDPRCMCDEERIAQAVSNLIGNALKYGPGDTPVKARMTVLRWTRSPLASRTAVRRSPRQPARVFSSLWFAEPTRNAKGTTSAWACTSFARSRWRTAARRTSNRRRRPARSSPSGCRALRAMRRRPLSLACG